MTDIITIIQSDMPNIIGSFELIYFGKYFLVKCNTQKENVEGLGEVNKMVNKGKDRRGVEMIGGDSRARARAGARAWGNNKI